MFGVCAFSQIFYPEDQRLSLCITRKIEVRRKKALHSISRKNYVRRQIAFSNYLDLVSHRQKLLQWPLKFERPILYHLYSFNVSKKVFSVWPFDKSSYKSVGAYSTPNLKNHFCIQFGQSSVQKTTFYLNAMKSISPLGELISRNIFQAIQKRTKYISNTVRPSCPASKMSNVYHWTESTKS